jgi:hypothetical protein
MEIPSEGRWTGNVRLHDRAAFLEPSAVEKELTTTFWNALKDGESLRVIEIGRQRVGPSGCRFFGSRSPDDYPARASHAVVKSPAGLRVAYRPIAENSENRIIDFIG